ncbi:hypothetical protein CP357_06545 [Lactobacillus sp. UMNPBX6]|nr:hypothetical protein CP365_06540 [Lactobacillus sp. UMNPBX14]PEH02244.1 hypothetical protein CP357_06545 [Lactobacillus sp. UMNPBX6]
MIIINKIQKLEAKFREKPIRKDLTFAEAKKLLEYYHYTLHNENGRSHYTIERKVKKYPTTIANHGILKRYNIKDILAMIDQIKGDN